MFGQNRLGMKLDAVGLVLTMLEPHDLFLGCDGGHFEFGGDRVVNDKRVIAHRFER